MGAIRQGRILVVEDESALRSLTAQFLRMEGFEVVEAADGREGVERFFDLGPFDVVLLDLNLPALPGVEVCRRIKIQEPAQRFIICSAAVLDGHVAALATLNVDQVLSKPYHPAELLNRIALELDRAQRHGMQPSADLRATGSWRVDPAASRSQTAHRLFKLPAID
ncbi:MAG: response regulator transcription factor [Isosphaeraceae bacterium]